MEWKNKRYFRWYFRRVFNIIFSYSLTYVDLIDTLAVMGYKKEFKKAVSKLPKLISFDRDIDISVYLLFY